MKKVEKRRLNKNLLHLIILGVMLAVLLTAFFIVKAVSKNQSQGGGNQTVLPDIREELGESTYVNVPIAYPRVEEKQMDYILVYNRDDDGKLRVFDLTSLEDGSFVLSYSIDGTTKNMKPYIPSIVGTEGDFDYTDLYAIETNDTYGRIYLLTYLCTAVGTPYFSERIDLPADPTAREDMLKRFGLDEENAAGIAFTYKNPDGTDGNHKITVGARALSGNGFYFTVDDRDVVYYTTSNYFRYALLGFEEFVNGRLVAEGLEIDKNFEPYLTTDFKQWVNTEHTKEGERVTAGSTVIAKGTEALPLLAGSGTDGYENGYALTDGTFTFSALDLKEHEDYERFSKLLVGLKVGKQDTPVRLTLINELAGSSSFILDFSKADSLEYSYKITAIESVITETAELTDPASLGGAQYNLVKIAYDLYIGGEKQNTQPLRAILDLRSSSISSSVKDEIRAAGIGTADITLDISYTKDNSRTVVEKLYINAISAILSKDGEYQTKVTKDSIVTFSYYEVINGKKTLPKSVSIDLAAQDDSDRWADLKSKIIGRGVDSNLSIKLYENTYYYEALSGFAEFRIDEILEFVTSELVVSFRYVNKVEQDPFYGESVYENTMAEHEGYGQYSIYGIDSTVCTSVLNLLGGVGEGSTTTVSAGYKGETVAVGLDHYAKVKYGLYAHTVYLELPRGIYDPSDFEEELPDGDSTDLSDIASYAWEGTLGFTLYISDEQDGYRYVGSDQFDLVARVPADDFSFLDYSFSELWARNNFLFMDVTNIKEISFDFSMTDYYGKYEFDVSRETWYVGQSPTGGGMASIRPFEGSTPTTRLYVDITSSTDAMPTEYERIKDEKGLDSLSVSAIYSELYNGGKDYFSSSIDTVGIVNYKSLFEKLFLTSYQDRVLTESEISGALSRQRLMRMSVKVFENDGDVRPGYYTYDFYYVDGSRVMISAFRTDNAGNPITERVSDFTISNYAFENIVLSVFGILNGKTLDENSGYIDKK